MATITLRPDVYDKAAIFARKDKLNIEDWVNKILQKIIVDISEKEDMKAPAESKMFSWDEWAACSLQIKVIKNCVMSIWKKNMGYENLLLMSFFLIRLADLRACVYVLKTKKRVCHNYMIHPLLVIF